MKKIDIHTHVPQDDPGMDNYLSIMDTHDVEAILVHAIPFEAQDNPDVLKAVNAHSDRLFGSVHIDLRKPLDDCIQTLRQYADEGFRCVKMFPNFGFDPNEEQYEPFWQIVEDLGLMCLPHCGWVSNNERILKYADMRVQSLTATPFHFEIPMRRHPGINFIFAHFGGGANYLETITLTLRLPNAFADTCPGWGKWVFENRMSGLQSLDFSHVLYGTDNRGEKYTEDEAWWKETLLSMGRTEQELEQYFYKNGAKLLKIGDY